jgi:integrase
MGNRENFTAGRVDAFQCEVGKHQSLFWDAKTPGLGLRVTASGTKSYIFESRLNAKTLRSTIGDVRTWTVSKAQAEATRLKSLIDQGIDPRQLKAEQRAKVEAKQVEAKRQSVIVGEAWLSYLEARRQKWSPRHLQDHHKLAHRGGNPVAGRDRLSEPGALAALMPLRLAEINMERVKMWLRVEAARRPTQADLAFRLFRAFLNWCSDTPAYQGLATADACQTRIAKDALPKRNAKDDCLQREQLPAWFGAVRSINNPIIAHYLQALLLTGARREELAGIKWDDVDFQWLALTIKDKVEGERTIPLTPYVASLLAALPRRNEWVFSSPMAASGRLMEPSIQHRRVTSASDIAGMTLHGLRRSFGTLAEWVECPAGVSAQIMGHKPSAIAEKHYRRRPLDLLRMWHTKIEAWILEQAGVTFEAEQPGKLRAVK